MNADKWTKGERLAFGLLHWNGRKAGVGERGGGTREILSIGICYR